MKMFFEIPRHNKRLKAIRKLGHKHKRFVSGRGELLDSTSEGVHFLAKSQAP